ASLNQRALLERRIDVPSRIKMQNQNVLENLDIIQQAMREKRKVAFKYFSYNMDKEKELRRDGHEYILTPIRLIYADEFYYMIVFSDHYADMEGHYAFNPYRVDRMVDVHVSDEPATKDPRIANYITEEHLSPSFGIYAAKKVPIELEFDQEAMNPIIDKFGVNAVVFKKKRGRARAYVKAPLSPQFYGWLLQLGPLVKLISPTEAVDEFNALLEQTFNRYKNAYSICSEAARKVITQEQFLELVDCIKEKLEAHIDAERNGVLFETETEFARVAWLAAEQWLAKQGIDDGMPHRPPKPIETTVRGRKHTGYFASVNDKHYLVYGQILGEAIIALNPINFAADEHRTSFTNTFELYDQEWGNGFVFDALPPINKWKRIDHIKTDTIHTTISRCYLPHGAYYELQRNRNSKPLYDDEDNASDAAPTADSLICERVFFADPDHGIPKTELQPWSGTYKGSGSFKTALRHWQRNAYRYAFTGLPLDTPEQTAKQTSKHPNRKSKKKQ
ncbi:MAG: WYL domain-containing protein, partial [Eggerthellaceae bacterium]|nr:WYL domain-containing protein [Eggerthellaceae bacterium]